MIKRLPFVLLALLLVSTVYSQQFLKIKPSRQHASKSENTTATHLSRVGATTQSEKCGFVYQMQKAVDRGFDNDAFEAEINRLVQRRIAQGRIDLTGTVTIPIIFHIIYRTADTLGTTANLVTSKYQAQLTQLNRDYGNLSGSRWGAAANVPIRFCMALVDTAGRPLAEPGIDRINGQLRSWSNTNTQSQATLVNYFDNTIKPGSIWDPYSYVNVWTAAMNSSGLLGYATFPSLSTLPGLDNSETNTASGVVINWRSVGSVESPGVDAAYGYGRTLTHELGHFFGLRHIWGDSDCGNDYCADTPPQFQETSGCPTTDTLNNCTPLVRKMFENYMDYSNDACMNTFTGDQAMRSAAVMDNSPRRFSLITSKACQARAANAVSFISAIPQEYTETGTSGGCPNTKSYTFRVYPSVAASAAATLTFTTGGTATAGRDYTITPASVSFASGDAAAKTVTVTIIDDQEVEATETITLGYTIGGSGIVAGPDKQTISMTIADDDLTDVFAIDNNQSIKNILLQNFDTTTTGGLPTGWKTEVYSGSATAANQWTVSVNGGLGTTDKAAHITTDTTLKLNTYNNAVESDAYLFTPLLDASRLRDLNLVFKWRCLGETSYDYGTIGYVPEGQAPTAANVIYFTNIFGGRSATATAAIANINFPATFSGKRFYFVFNWYNDDNTGSSPGFTVDSIVMTGKAYAIASATDADTTFQHYSGQAITYFSKSTTTPVINRLIVKISGMSVNAGCITAAIAAAGTGRTVVTGGTPGTFYRTDKIVQLTPTTAVPSASYTVTLYYTAAELAVWGSQIPTLKILKLSDGAALNGPYQAGDAQFAATTFNDNSSNGGYYSYTGTFTGGFSRFMLVSSNLALPVSLVDFTAVAKSKSILLQWSTSQEVNNRGFALERSTDGVNFSRIAWISGKENTSTRTDYSYTDFYIQPNTQYYYRLRQTDLDGKEMLSGVRQARIGEFGINVTVSPVPAKNNLQVFVSGLQQAATISLTNAQGQLVKQWQNVSIVNTAYPLDVSTLPAGMYLLKVEAGGTLQTVQKVVLEK